MILSKNKISPLHQYFESIGFHPFQSNGLSCFKSFTSHEEEYNSIFNGVGLRDISDSSILEIRGKDTLDFLHRITTNNLKNLPAFESAKTIFTSDKGKILDCVQVINFGDFVFLCGSKGNEAKLMRWIERYVISDDIKINDGAFKYCILELFGSQANSFATLLFGKEVDELKVNQFKEFYLEDFTFYVLHLTDVNQKKKFWIISNPEYAKKIIDFSLTNKSVFQFNLIGDDAYQQYRIENGLPANNELNDLFNPFEINLKDLIDFQKGCYIGQEIISRLDTYGKIHRYLRGIVLDSVPEQITNLSLLNNAGKEAGIVTSLFPLYNNCKAIGLAVLNKDYIRDGTNLFFNTSTNSINVIVKNLPFKAY